MPRTDRTPRPLLDSHGARRTKEGKLGWRLLYGKPQRELSFYGSEAEARRKLAELEGAEEVAPVATKAHQKARTVDEAAEAWLMVCRWKTTPSPETGYEGVEHSPATVAKYVNVLNIYLVPGLHQTGQDKIAAVREGHLLKVITSRTLKSSTQDKPVPVSPGTMESIASVAKKWFKWLLANGWVTAYHAKGLSMTYTNELSKRQQLDVRMSDVERLARALDTVWKLPLWAKDLYGPNGEGRGDILRLFEYSGMRVEELFALPVTHIFRSDRVMWVSDVATESSGRRDHRTNDGKTIAAIRPLIILDEAMPVIDRLDAVRRRGMERE